MVKRKRSQLNEDQTEVDRVSDNTDNGKIIKSKKRKLNKIKQTNRNKSTKKVKSPVMSNDSANPDNNQQLLNDNHDNSVSPLSFFKKSSKVIKKSKVKTKNVTTIKGFMALNKNHDFSELVLKCYFLKFSFIKKFNILLIDVIVDDIHGDKEKHLTVLSVKSNHVLHHLDKYAINKSYMVTGGHVVVYRGKRQINITAHTKITLCKDQNVQSSYNFNQYLDKMLIDFTKIRTESADKVQTQYLVGWLYKIHEETHYVQQQTSCIPITIMDANGIGLKINLWNEFDKNQLQSLELNCSVVCTSWSLKQNGELYSISNNGVIFYNVDVPVKRNQSILVDNLSDVNSESIVINSIGISFKDILNAMHGNNHPIAFYKLENVRIAQIERLFKFRDENGVELNESMSGVIDNITGQSRVFNVFKDNVEYFVKCKIQDIDSNIFVYMNGFQTAGESIFNCKASELYHKYISTQKVNLKVLSEQVSLQGLNIIVKPYINRNQKLYWTLIHVYENWDLDQNE